MSGEQLPIGVTVVIPTYQRAESVLSTLECLSAQILPATQFEVVVVVDGSTDGTLEMLERWDSPYRLVVVWQDNARRAAACNAGIARARGQLLVILDDDMRPVPDFLTAHLRAHARHDRAGVLGAVPFPPGAALSPVGRYVRWKFEQHLEKLSAAGYELDLRDFYSGNFSIPTEIMREIGGYDPSFRLYGNEDLELFLRLCRANVEVVYAGDAIAFQTFDKDFLAAARDAVEKGRTAVLLASKHPAALSRLKLASFREGPRALRLVRNTLLAIGRRIPAVPERVAALTAMLERVGLPLPPRFYLLVLGYYYWVGALAEIAENRIAGWGLQQLNAVEPAGRG